MVEKGEIEKNESAPSSQWHRVVAMIGSIALVAVVFTLVGIFSPGAPKPDPPNIIFILIDDLGWNDVSFHGSPQIPTPNIDALAATGIILNNYYTHAQCTPSRAALMSGKYANRLGLQHGNLRPGEASGLPLNIITLPEYLKRKDYKTHMIGKWHLGYHKKSFFPTRRGFDSFFGFLNDNIDYYDYTCYYREESLNYQKNNKGKNASAEENVLSSNLYGSGNVVELFGVDLWENEEIIRDFRGEYVTDVFTQKALAVIDEHNTTKPLFLFLSHAATHAGNSYFPLQSPVDMFERNNHIKDFNRRTYAGMVSALDDSIGKVFQALSQKDMLNNTIIVISSDNGGDSASSSASNWPLRGSKFTLWEGGIRSVGVVWSPLLNLQKPRISDQLMHITDWLPTFYYIADGDDEDLGDIDGKNMWSTLLVEERLSPRKEVLNIDPISGIGSLRKGDLKLHASLSLQNSSDWFGPSGLDESNVSDSLNEWIWKNGSLIKDILTEKDQWLLTENDTWRQDAKITCGVNFFPVSGKCDFTEGPCLYNVTDDPCEYKNIASLYPEVVEEMLKRLQDLNSSSIPVQTKDIDPMGDPICHNFAHVPWMDEEYNCLLS